MIYNADLSDRAARLFQFLAQAQVMRARPVRDVDDYKRSAAGGQVHWVVKAPEHSAVRSAYRDVEPTDGFLLSVDRLIRQAPPEVPPEIVPWLKGDPDKATVVPALLERRRRGKRFDFSTQQDVEEFDQLSDHPEIVAAFERWMSRWRPWSEREKLDAPVRDYYAALYETFLQAESRNDEFELVLGVGLLSWNPGDLHPTVRRHVFTCPVVATMDNRTGRLTFKCDAPTVGLSAELEMLEASLLPRPSLVQETRTAGETYDAHPFDVDALKALALTVVNSLGSQGTYAETTTAPSANPTISREPALILRPRTNAGLVRIFNDIADHIESSGTVPAGLRTLVDPDQPAQALTDPAPGALQVVDGETFSPLPLNTVQRDIINRVDTHAQTLVKGPPGTGKTHTAAALLSHLLAQGKRVLVTAHTDRALEEVRGKLPKGIQALAVSVIGASRAELTELKTAVETIAHRAQNFNAKANEDEIDRLLARLDDLGSRRSDLTSSLVRAREAEAVRRSHSTYDGTLSTIAQQLTAEQPRFEWIAATMPALPGKVAPLTDTEALRWLELLRDSTLDDDAPESRMRLVDLQQVPTPESFLALVDQQRSAGDVRSAHSELLSLEAARAVEAMPSAERHDLQARMRRVIQMIERLEQAREEWVRDALSDIRAGAPQVWDNRATHVRALLERLDTLTARLPLGTNISYTGDLGTLTALAEHLTAFLSAGGAIKTNPDGTAKIGLLTPGAVKQSRALFESVRVNRRQPTTTDALDAFLAHVEAEGILEQLDRAWPAAVQIPEEDTIGERAAWHETQVSRLALVLELGATLMAEEESLASVGLARPDWTDVQQVLDYARLVDAAAADEAWRSATQPIEALTTLLGTIAAWPDAAPCVRELREAVVATDHEAYATARRRIHRLHEVSAQLRERESLGRRMHLSAGVLASSVESDPTDAAWPDRLASLTAAWNWATTRSWLVAQDSTDVNDVQAQLTALESEIHDCVAAVAQHRAWGHAVSPSRLPASARAELVHYSQLVKKLGKGTGKNAALVQADIRRSMDRCRSSVPVWIMPIYRIAEQLPAEEDMFDVVLVDEASQAGHEATFLQYLAKKIVVVGDDMQVSPTAVGVDTDSLIKLADQYIPDHPHKGTWADPKQSFFNEAVKRYGGQLTLVEHRRCVPEIIEFSNAVAYRPNNVELIPVRQYGARRLDPIKVVHLADGQEHGASNKTNPVEARAIVDQIKALIDDPRYNGLSFGVISLVGAAQAKHIFKLLLAEIPAEEWSARDIRVGDAADFQGSERDVMFLSMVSSAGEDIRLAALNTEMYLQRFNVAVSRAKDQLWLFHSLTQNDLKLKDDLRYQLLEYCYSVVNRVPELDSQPSKAASESTLEARFNNLFQQRVHNRIVERGYTVVPSYASTEGFLDLVVIGASGRLAIECQGDTWGGETSYSAELARQRELQRCGWHFFRIRESAFYLDSEAALSGLWPLLDELGILPFDESAEAAVEAGHALDDAAVDAGVDDAPTVEASDGPEADAEGSYAAAVAVPHEDAVTVSLAAPDAGAPAHDWSLFDDTDDDVDEDEPELGEVLAYTPFRGTVPKLTGSSLQAIHEGLIDIVRVEGPITGDRLQAAYTEAGLLGRPSKQVTQLLNQAISRAVQTKELVEDDPLSAGGVKRKTYRLPKQPLVRLRHLGPRSYDQVPAREVAELLRVADSRFEWDTQGELYRNAIRLLDRRSLTDEARYCFDRVRDLAFGAPEAGQSDVGGEVRKEWPVAPTAGSATVSEVSQLAKADAGHASAGRPATWRRYGRDPEEWVTLVDETLRLLRATARERGALTYSELNLRLAEDTGLRTFDLRTDVGRHAIGSLLEDVTRLDYPQSGVMLSALVTLKGQADVGHGFYSLAQELGLLGAKASPEDKEAFWVGQVSQSHQLVDM